jgi:hypothetical protein
LALAVLEDGQQMSYSGNESVQVSFRHDEKEFLAATRLYFWHARELLVRLIVIDVAFVILMLLLNLMMNFILPLWAVVGLSVLAWVAWFHAVVIDLPRTRFRGDPKFRDEYHLTFREEGIAFQTENINATYKWNFYSGVIENDDFYLLTYGKHINSFSVLPKRAFRDSNQETLFRRMLRRHLAPNLKLGAGEQETHAYVPKSTAGFEPPDWR